MKVADLLKLFQAEVTLVGDKQDYARTSAWLRAKGINPGAKAPNGQGIIPYLVHSKSAYTVEIDWS